MPGVGDTLREARLSRGLTHEYISQIIKIRPEFLDALEEENYTALPGNFYAKNFLRRYSDFLGVDSAALVDRFVRQESEPNADASDAFVVSPAARAPGTVRHWRPNLGIMLALLLLATVGLALAYTAFEPKANSGLDQAAVTSTPNSMPVALAPTPTSAPDKPTPQATPPRAQSTATKPREKRGSPIRRARRSKSRPKQGNTRPATRPRPTATRTSNRVTTPKSRNTPTPTPRPTKTPTPEPTKTPTPEPTDTPRPTNTPTPTPEPTDTPTPTPTSTPTPKATGAVVVAIRTAAASSVTVKSDGRTVFQGPISPGSSRSFAADANLYVYSPSAQNVLVAANECVERTLDSYGCPGCQVAYFNFPRTYQDCR